MSDPIDSPRPKQAGVRYRKISPRIWLDEKFTKLSPVAKLVALYVLTSSQTNRIGFFTFSVGKALEECQVPQATFAKAFKSVLNTLNWRWDPPTRTLYLPTWWRYNRPDNANVLNGNLKDLDDLPDNPFLSEFGINTKYLPFSHIQTFTQTLAKRYPERSPNQYQEQEQEQEQNKEIGLAGLKPDPPKVSSAYPEAEKILAFLNFKAGKRFPARSPKGKPTGNLEVIMQRLNEGYSEEQCRQVIALKTRAWKGQQSKDGKMLDTYLRPSTLFGKKNFETYIGELGSSREAS